MLILILSWSLSLQKFRITMMGLYFEKIDKLAFLSGENYIKVSNNLDSQYYVLERVKNGGKDYLSNNYFTSSHLQLIEYLTSWNQKEIIQEQVPVIKKIKEKKGIMGGLLTSKKSKMDTSTKPAPKQPKEEVQIVTIQEQALYIQLQSFSEVNVPTDIEQAKQFMALIYLLSMRIHQKFNFWPQMIPVITESKRYKFIKKGKKIELQLVRLLDFIFKEGKEIALHSWSQQLSAQIQGIQSEEERRQKIGSFLLASLENILKSDFQIKLKKGQEWQALTVSIEDAFTLHFKQTSQQILIDEYQIVYYHHDSETRQIIMQHNIENTIILQGNRSNLIIKYLKQFVNG